MIRNYLSLIVSQIASRLISFFWVIYLARALGLSDYGRYGTVLSIVSILMTTIDLGVSFIIIREIGLHPEKKARLIGLQICQRGVLAFLCSLAMICLPLYSGYSQDYLLLFGLASIHMTAIALGTVGDTVFAIHRRQFLIAIMNTLQSGGWAILGYIALRSGAGLQGLFLAMAVNSAVLFVIYFLLMRRFVIPVFHWERQEVFQILKWSIPIGLTGFFGMVFDKADRVLLSWIQDASQVALFNVGTTLLIPLTDMVWSASIIILYPYMPALFRKEADFIRAFRSILTWLVALFLPMMAGAFLFSDPIINLVFGEKFAASAPLMSIATFYMLFVPFHGLMGRILIIQNRQILYAKVNFVVMVLSLSLNFLLIPKYGPFACAWVSVATHASLVLFYTLIGHVDIRPYLNVPRYFYLLLSVCSAATVAWAVPNIHVLLRLLVLLAVYIPLSTWILRLRSDAADVKRLVTA